MALRVVMFDSCDPEFDLAFEEALARLRAKDMIPDTLRLWRTSRSVVLGYFRSAEEDVDLDLAGRKGVPIIRRFTGGGTVYLDRGCVNYSVVIKKDVEFPVSYLYGTILRGTLAALESLGFSPYLRNANDVVVGGRKVSGTAASIRWGVLFLHGSILFDADLGMLRGLLRVPERLKPSVDPVKYLVANLSEFTDSIDAGDVMDALVRGYSEVLSEKFYMDEPMEEELNAAEILHGFKYSRDEWNLRLPSYHLRSIEEGIEKELRSWVSNPQRSPSPPRV
ncbi:biotin/lipoate A/B protein ligase family protein [Thermococcus sp. ES12]|uniref:lipoate--protein ligase family protein n=1 Tax=Thermococcus sp. ES12 TaxID=1638246 RepID=UPI00142F62A3|nr:biotin/lipoate A/B protein ligase family protein [Thermococcus sp. ES12]NJE76825.1 lipoate--protein ligase family protein [Thermococcus sp. ES12]